MNLEKAYRGLILRIFGIDEASPEATDLMLIREDDLSLINLMLADLTDTKQRVIRMGYQLDGGLKKPTFEQIGQKIGGITKKKVTRERARQIERKALRRLRYSSKIEFLERLFRTKLEEQLVAREKEIQQIKEVRKKEKPLEALSIEDLNLSTRSYNCLKREGISNLQELADYPASKLMQLRNFGSRSLREIEETLAKYGLSLSGKSSEAISPK